MSENGRQRRSMRRGQRRSSHPRATSAVLSIVAALISMAVLWGSGYTISHLSDTANAVLRSDAILSREEKFTALLVALAWGVSLLLMTRGVWMLVSWLAWRAQQAVSVMSVTRQRTMLGIALTFIASVATTTTTRGTTMDSHTEVAGDDSGMKPLVDTDQSHHTNTSSAVVVSPIGVRDSSWPLPALASAGLALGLTTHVQRERAILLRDAPNSARLERPTAAALATGIALFERAKTADESLVVDSPSAVSQPAAPQPPVVIPLGVAGDRLISIALRVGECVSIDAAPDHAAAILRHVLNTVALAPWLHAPTVIMHGFSASDVLGHQRLAIASTALEACQQAMAAKHRTTNATVIVIARSYCSDFDRLAEHGVMVVTSGVNSASPAIRIVRETHLWRVSTTNECFQPYGVSASEAEVLRQTIAELTTLARDTTNVPEHRTATSDMRSVSWHTMVRVLGPVQVMHRGGAELEFRKSKSVELLCWLAFHRDRPTVSMARTALWEIDVQDATFHNVLSELRHGLALGGLSDGAGRRNKQRLFLDDRVTTDSELLRNALQQAETLQPLVALTLLREALSSVQGLPFSSVHYAWADAEGITSTVVWLVTRTVEHAAELACLHDDRTALLEVTAAGLRMTPGDERFLSLREQVFANASE